MCGGKQRMTMQVTPALQQQIVQKSYTDARPKEITTIKPLELKEDTVTPYLSKINEVQKKKYGSPTNQTKKLVPLSKKFSAYPISDVKSTGNQSTKNGKSRNNMAINPIPGNFTTEAPQRNNKFES